ncbi:hypothetical protein KDK_03560 [Dictyobacter kobayashii]|uniref:Uncharacterized protein n=1 Tax=Dictyobacter kobayashii TaxID=2014872 RepID=A0A402ABT4_9CHLR|nr:hypothetical protein KDK_03560 [Dictyobacter kobayashii]
MGDHALLGCKDAQTAATACKQVFVFRLRHVQDCALSFEENKVLIAKADI